MTIITLANVSIAYGHQPLLKNANLQIDRGERVCLVGRNGTGKSTLFHLLSGTAQADEGEIRIRDTLRISCLQQEVPLDASGSIYDMVSAGLGDLGSLLREHHQLSNNLQSRNLDSLSDLQQRIEAMEGWNMEQKVEALLSRLSLPADQDFADCSGGTRRRVMLARALISNPDILLLDEPTNHMDISSINWLEEYLAAFHGTLLFITHDRTLIRHLATRIIELDRGTLSSFSGNYDEYLKQKQAQLDAESRAFARFDKALAEHEIWVRQGIRARRTRNEGRVRQLKEMRDLRRQRVEKKARVGLQVNSGDSSGKLVVELSNISFGFGEQVIVRDFSSLIMRGDRVGIIGPNGSGKSTLLHILLGELKPDSGRVKRGTRLQVAYFDQQRAQLDEDKSVRENISTSDHVTIAGRSRHVVSYMKDFLFDPERINSPVRSLSGGERNRLLLARIFTQPANLLVLDEPTNDLDVETLELLEELLTEYDGTLLLVSHDRYFLDQIVTSTIAFEGDGKVREYVGGYEDWLRQRQPTPAPTVKGNTKKPAQIKAKKTKLGYREQQELLLLPEAIEELEQQQQLLETRISDSDFYKQQKEEITSALAHLEKIRAELARAYERWVELDSF